MLTRYFPTTGTASDASKRAGNPRPRFPALRTIRERLRRAKIPRGRLWTLVWVTMGALAVYVLLPELDALQASLRSLQAVHPGWILLGIGFVALRYAMAVWSLQFALGRPLPFGPTLLVQVSASFIGRLTPEGVGWLVLNQRYLERQGIERATALAGLTLKIVAGVLMRLAITLAIAAMAGAAGVFGFEVPDGWPYGLAAGTIAALIAGLLSSKVRSAVTRAMVRVRSATHDVAGVVRDPLRAAGLFGTSAALTIINGLALAAILTAFGEEPSLVEVLAAYLGATAVAAVSPTPGNLGAVEVALAAALAAVDVSSGTAVGAVLVYRLLTFWTPLVPGFIAFRYLQSRQHI